MNENETTSKSPSPLAKALRLGAPLVLAGAIGAGIAVGVGAAVGTGGTTTVVEQVGASEASAQQPAAFTTNRQNLSVQQIYRRSAPGVVQITATSTLQAQDPFGGSQQQRALGSGFVIDKAGHIVTNYHVVQGAQEVEVNFSGRDQVRAKVVGVDPSTDIAVLQVSVPARALTPLSLGNSDAVQVGDSVVAIGNPFGLDRTVTQGIVSALQRHITAPNGFQIDHVLQTDAAINHGNSGGPLINSHGEVIGVNSQIQSGGIDGNVGIGFAVPINTVKGVASQIIETGKVEHAYLGVEMQTITPDLATNFKLPVDRGVLIVAVRQGAPAASAGLRGGDKRVTLNGQDYVLGGDIVTKADGKEISSYDQLRDIVLAKKPGDVLSLEVNRNGKTLSFSIQLGRQPTTPTG